MTRLWPKFLALSVTFCGVFGLLQLLAQEKPAQAPAAAPASGQNAASSDAKTDQEPFFIHGFHVAQLGLDCNACHVPEKEGSVMLQRPGHDQCMVCHADAFGDNLNQKICAQCHTAFPPTSADDLLPFPRFKKKQAILFEFAHSRHVDTLGRIDPRTGFRADCTFCHQFDAQGVFATFPRHDKCAACHSKPGMKPRLTADSTTEDCRGCHTPEEIENPGFTEERRMIAPHVASGVYVNLKFAHAPHFKNRERLNINCTTCHYAVPTSTSLANLTLPQMVDCVQCHDNDKTMPAQFRMSNCSTCHIDQESGAAPAGHTRYVKPAFHTENFRQHHEAEASAPGAKCYVCHVNVSAPAAVSVPANVAPAAATSSQCVACHQVMRPASHTARWRDDLHGKFAAIDRTSCAMCHTADTCSRCHNETPRSHEPLALFTGGAHARLAMLNQRACLTCHTFQNTCAECHVSKLQ
jgi:hypothetical protein